jgi:hypothetical protein
MDGVRGAGRHVDQGKPLASMVRLGASFIQPGAPHPSDDGGGRPRCASTDAIRAPPVTVR